MRVGIDGCRGGWIAVAIDERGAAERIVLDRIDEVSRFDAAITMIDMPIGLPPRGRRACDLEARRTLGAARSRLFLDARRPLLDFFAAADYSGANGWGKSNGAGVSVQLWNILGKIAEIDRFITPAKQETIYEAHPELAFARLNGDVVLPPKKTREGLTLRRDLVAAAGIEQIDAWLGTLRGSGAGADDLLDACALALAARAPHRVAAPMEMDERGLRMEIWY
jgi:predicted RNase H-like nuclease